MIINCYPLSDRTGNNELLLKVETLFILVIQQGGLYLIIIKNCIKFNVLQEIEL